MNKTDKIKDKYKQDDNYKRQLVAAYLLKKADDLRKEQINLGNINRY